MKTIVPFIMLLMFLSTSCAPLAQPTEAPASDSPSTPADDSDPLEEMLVSRLSANLGIDESEITVESVRDVEFGDLCFDIPSPDIACAQVVTPGRIFILEANGIEYEYRTDAAGDSIRPATLALTWRREGGIAGFCDRLTVYLSGEVIASNCRSEPNETSGSLAELLSATQQREFNSWYTRFGETKLDVSDPAGVSDRMTNILEFFGDGTGRPGRADQAEMFDWALELFRKLNS